MTPEEIALSVQLTRNAERLAFNLKKMRQSLESFAKCLLDTRESKCWKLRDNQYSSFDDFCRKELHITEGRASQIISAGNTMLCLAGLAETQEEKKLIHSLSAGAVEPLAKVEPVEALRILKTISSEGKVTAAKIKTALGKPAVKRPTICPNCGAGL